MLASTSTGSWLVEHSSGRRLAFGLLCPLRYPLFNVSEVEVGRLTQLVPLLCNLHAAIADLLVAYAPWRVDHVVRYAPIVVKGRMSLSLED